MNQRPVGREERNANKKRKLIWLHPSGPPSRFVCKGGGCAVAEVHTAFPFVLRLRPENLWNRAAGSSRSSTKGGENRTSGWRECEKSMIAAGKNINNKGLELILFVSFFLLFRWGSGYSTSYWHEILSPLSKLNHFFNHFVPTFFYLLSGSPSLFVYC